MLRWSWEVFCALCCTQSLSKVFVSGQTIRRTYNSDHDHHPHQQSMTMPSSSDHHHQHQHHHHHQHHDHQQIMKHYLVLLGSHHKFIKGLFWFPLRTWRDQHLQDLSPLLLLIIKSIMNIIFINSEDPLKVWGNIDHFCLCLWRSSKVKIAFFFTILVPYSVLFFQDVFLKGDLQILSFQISQCYFSRWGNIFTGNHSARKGGKVISENIIFQILSKKRQNKNRKECKR